MKHIFICVLSIVFSTLAAMEPDGSVQDIFEAIRKGLPQKVQHIVEQDSAQVAVLDPCYKRTPMHEVCCDFSRCLQQKAKIIKILVEHGADVNDRSGSGLEPPLYRMVYYACKKTYEGKETDISRTAKAIITFLLERGADITVGDCEKCTCIHKLAQLQHMGYPYASRVLKRIFAWHKKNDKVDVLRRALQQKNKWEWRPLEHYRVKVEKYMQNSRMAYLLDPEKLDENLEQLGEKHYVD